MDKLKAFLAQAKWVGYVLVAAAVAITVLLLRSLFTKPGEVPAETPKVPEALQAAVDAAEEQATVTKIKAKTQADTTVAAMNEASKISDGKKRREALASIYRGL